MNKYQFTIAICTTSAICNSVFAYDLHTHTAMTSEAVAQSKFTRDPKSSAIIKQLGIKQIAIPFGDRYIDIGSQVISRNSSNFEADIMDTVRDADGRLVLPASYTLTGWLMRGAIREDDNALETPNSDEPGGVFSRVYGHFFDPHNNRGLTFPWGNDPIITPVAIPGFPGLPAITKTFGGRSVDWALTSGTTADGRQNHYKITDAREAMWRALTPKQFQGGILSPLPMTLNNSGNPLPRELEGERNAYWATTFRALGDVVHLLQDTARPQHTHSAHQTA
jgi:hypothetical protein